MVNNQRRIGFSIDFKKGDQSGLRELRTQLEQLQQLTVKEVINTGNLEHANQKLEAIQGTAKKVQQALEDSYNAKLDTTDLNKFQKSLQSQGLTLKSIKDDFAQAGIQGQIAFRNLNTELLTTSRYTKQTSEWLDKMANTLGNTVRWSIASTAVNSVTGSIQKAYSYTKQLDISLNDIRIVTEKSSEEMDKFARKANEAAKALGATTTDYTKASLIYYQQGLSDQEVAARANVTTKVANVTGVSADTASEQLTAIWNGYKVQAQEAELYIDKVSAVAAKTAADLEELSIGMSKVASAANIMGVDIDQLNAQLATIVSVTREAPESIGTALKTVYARMSDIEAGLDSETTLGEYTEQMAQMGINALDAKGNLRDMGEVVEEIGDKWTTLNRNQQTSLAQTIAGTRQYSRMMALFDNWDMYQQSKATSEGAAGALEKQNEIYLDSMEAHLNQLSAAAEGLYDSLLDPESLNKVIDLFTKVVGLADQFVQSLGGGGNLLMTIGAIGMNVFGTQITRGLTSTIRNTQGLIANLKNANSQAEIFQEILNANLDDEKYAEIIKTADHLREVSSLMTDEEREQVDLLLKKKTEMINQEALLKEQKMHAEDIYRTLTGESLDITKEGAIEELEAQFKEATRGQDISFFSELGKLVYENQDISTLNRSRGQYERFYNRFSAQDWANSSSSTVITDGVGYDFESIEESERTLHYRQEVAKTEKEIAAAIENQKNKLSDFYETNLVNIKITDKELELFKTLNIVDDEEIVELERLQRLLEKINKNKTVDPGQLNELQEKLTKYQKIVDKAKVALKQAGDEAAKYNKKIEQTKKVSEEAESALKKFTKNLDLSKGIEGVVKLAGGLANVGTAVSNIKNLGNIWSDESLTGGEKLLQTLSNVSFTIPMIVSGIQNIRSGIGSAVSVINTLKNSYLIWNTAAAAKIALDKEDISQMQEKSFWMHLVKENNENLTEEEKKQIATILVKNKVLTEENIVQLKSIVGDGLKAASLKKVGDAAKKAGLEIVKMTAEFLASPVGMILLAVAAAVAAVTIAVKVGSEAYNKYNLKMEEASKAAEHQAQVYQDVKKAYEDLKASIENYEGAQKAIDEMTEGTEEWRDAIIEANKEVTELIEKYPQLAKYLNRDEDNRLTLDSEGLRVAQLEASKASDLAYSQSVGANAALAIAKGNAKAETIAQNSDYANFGTVIGGLFKNAIISPIATISEAIIKKDLLSVYEGETSTDDILAIAQALNTEEGAAKDFRQLIEDTLEGESKAQVDALEENSDEIRALAEQLKNNADAESELSTSIMDAYLRGTSSEYRESEYQAQISAIAGSAYDEALERAQAKFADNGISGSTYTDAQIQQMYADMMVETGQWQSVQHVSDKSGNKGKYTYIDASGKQQSGIEIDDIVARQALAVYEAQKEAGGDLSEITDIFEKVLISGNEKVDKQLANMLAGRKVDFNALNASEKDLFEDLVNDIELTNEEIAQLGKKSIDAVKETAISAFDNFEKDMNEFINKMNSDSTSRYDNIRKSVFANSQLTSGAELALAQMYGSNNTAIIDNFEALVTRFGESADDFLNLLPGLSSGQDLENWKTAIYGETEFREILNDDLFNALVSELETTFDLYDAYSKKTSQENFAYLKSLTSKVSQWEDIISKEDFAKLPPELKTYFTEMADGTAILTEEADKYIERTNKIAQQQLVDDVIKTRDALADLIAQRSTVASENEAYEEKIKSLPDKAAEVDYIGQLREVLAEHGSTTGVLTAPFLINKNDKEINAEYTEYARQMLGWLSDTIAPGTDKHFIDIMREKSVDVDYWYKKIVTDKRVTEEILQGLQIGIQQANAQIEAARTSNMPTKTVAGLETEIEAAEADYAAAQKALLAGAGTKENFDYYKKEGYFEGFDLAILAEYEEFYNNQEKKFQQLADLSYKLTQSGRDIVKLNKYIEKYSEDFDKAFGDDKIAALDNLDRAFGDLDTTLNQDLGTLEEIRKRELEDFSQFDQVLTQFGIDVKDVRTDENGEILNYDSLIRKGTEFAIKNGYSLERMEELYAAFDRYYGLLDDVKNKEEEIEENKQNWYENDVKRFDTLLQNQLDYTEAQKQYNSFLREMADEDDYSVLTQSYLDDYLFAQQDVLSVKQQIEKVNSSALNEADKQVKLIELQAQLQEKILTAKEAYNQLLEFETESMESISNNYDQIVSVVEQLMDIEENRFKIHQLMGASLEDEVVFYQQQIGAQRSILNQRKEEYEYWRAIYNDTALNEETREEARRKMLESGQEVASLSATLAQAVADNLERSVDLMMEKTFGALEALKEEYDWLVKDSDRSYDKITGMFRVSELESMIEREKAQNASISAQRKLNDFLEEEIKVLREKDKLTEYDYERAKARFELLQAQIALEEAQANKTTMRLVRGADGSYSYQYVADVNTIAEKEQDVLSAQEAVMQLDREEVQEYYEGIYDTVQDFIDRFKKLFTDDNFLSEEDVALLTPIWDSLLEQLGDVDAISEKLKSSIRESATALGIEDFNNLSDEQMKELFPWMDSGMYTAIRGFMSGTTALTKDTFMDLIAKANATGEASGIQGLFDFLGADFTTTMNNAGEDTKVGLAGELENLKSTVSTIDQTIKPLAEQFGNLKTAIMAFIDGLHESNILAYDGEGYDTGGYTGAWGTSGKLAVLHEKELVLNKEDTPNILSAVEIVRNLSADLDLSMMNRLAEMMKSYDSSMADWEAAKDWVIEQQVNIQAEFPNVTEKSEIEEAFEELINMATQRAYPSRK